MLECDSAFALGRCIKHVEAHLRDAGRKLEKVSRGIEMEERSSGTERLESANCPYTPLLLHKSNGITDPANKKYPSVQGHPDRVQRPLTLSSQQSQNQSQGICDRIEAQLSNLGKGKTWLGIFLGQICSALLCLSSITSVFLIDLNVRLPNAQNFAFYLLLSLVFTSVLACRRGERNLFPVLRLRGWKYLLVAVADVEGNFLLAKAYQFTTLTSVQLLDCFTIPTVLSLSWLILRIRFKVPHILGVFICLLGVSCLVWADVDGDGRTIGTGRERFIGDMMSLGGAFLHGISGVAQEFVVKTFDWVEFLGMIGVIGSLVAGIQVILLESTLILECPWTEQTICLLGVYAVAHFLLYLAGSIVCKLSSATALNLSLLSADFYALLLGIQLFDYKFHALFFLSFVLVMVGVMIFAIKPTSTAPHLYRSLVREQTTITTDLELIASGTYLPPQPTATLEDHHYTSAFNGGPPTTLHRYSNQVPLSPSGGPWDEQYLDPPNGQTYVIPEHSQTT